MVVSWALAVRASLTVRRLASFIAVAYDLQRQLGEIRYHRLVNRYDKSFTSRTKYYNIC